MVTVSPLLVLHRPAGSSCRMLEFGRAETNIEIESYLLCRLFKNEIFKEYYQLIKANNIGLTSELLDCEIHLSILLQNNNKLHFYNTNGFYVVMFYAHCTIDDYTG